MTKHNQSETKAETPLLGALLDGPNAKKGFVKSSLDTFIANRRLILRALITLAYYGLLFYIIRLLFFYKPNPEFKDIVMVIVGALVANLAKVTDFWFRREAEEQQEGVQD